MAEKRLKIAIVAMIIILFLLLPLSVFGQGYRGLRDYGRHGGYSYDPCADIYNPHGRVDCGIGSISHSHGHRYGGGYGHRGSRVERVAETAIVSGVQLAEAIMEYKLANKTIDRTYPPPSRGGVNPVYDQDREDDYRPIRSSRIPAQEEPETYSGPQVQINQPVQVTVKPTSTDPASPLIMYTVRNLTHVWVAVKVDGWVVKYLAPVGQRGSEDTIKLQFGDHDVRAFALATSDNGNVTKECKSQMFSDGSGWDFSKGGGE